MFERFGPWSSALNDGPSTRLSTFWKRRLAMLASARSARLDLSRRDWLKLGTAGAAACALPTLHFATADGPGLEGARPPARGKIYVQADFQTGPGAAYTKSGIFAIDPDTSAYVQVRDFDGGISLSPDGRTMAIVRAGKTGPDGRDIDNAGVWTLDAEGKGEMHRVADFGGVTSWSPDAKQLIVVKTHRKHPDDVMRTETWRFNADGSGATRLPIRQTEEVDDWSPDGRWLVTVSDRHPPHGSGYQLYLMRPDGTEQRRLTEGRGLNVYPRFSPDGKRIAYLHLERGETSVWVVDIDGSGRRRVLPEESDASPDHCCWSPDGKALACTIRHLQRDGEGRKHLRAGDGNPQIVIIDAEGKDRRTLNLPRAKWIGAPDWR